MLTPTEVQRLGTVVDAGAICARAERRDFEGLLVPRGGIEPPTRGFSVPFRSLGKSKLPSGDVRQAPLKTRQGRYAEARSCTVCLSVAAPGPAPCPRPTSAGVRSTIIFGSSPFERAAVAQASQRVPSRCSRCKADGNNGRRGPRILCRWA